MAFIARCVLTLRKALRMSMEEARQRGDQPAGAAAADGAAPMDAEDDEDALLQQAIAMSMAAAEADEAAAEPQPMATDPVCNDSNHESPLCNQLIWLSTASWRRSRR